MFDFLTSEVWWMETILIAVITGVFTFVASMFGTWAFYNYRLKAIKDDTESLGVGNKELKAEHKDLHKDLAKKHDDLSNEQRELSDKLKLKIDNLEKIILVENNDQKHRHNSLTENQKVMVESIGHLNDFAREMEKLQYENNQLKSAIQLLKEQLSQQHLNQESDWEPEI